ncbi:MAG: energy transducer TonB [Bacteroidia bacterium]|nr:energy transducer TonB [Bacteroidia bacterium]
MRKLLFPLFTLILFSACATDEAADSATDSVEQYSESGVDTFIVGKKGELAESETAEGESLRLENDTALENMRIGFNAAGTTENESVSIPQITRNPDVAPSFPGGSAAMDQYIAKKLIYPAVAFQNDVEGDVHVSFVVESNGKRTGIYAKRKLGFGCDESAIDLIAGMPDWIPGKKAGIPVRCEVTIPVHFGKKSPY